MTEAGLSRCLHLPLLHFWCSRGRVEQAVLRQKEERLVAAEECELRDCGLPGLRRHEPDIVFRHHIFASTIRPHYRVELRVCLLPGSKVDSNGLAGIKIIGEARGGNNVIEVGDSLLIRAAPKA